MSIDLEALEALERDVDEQHDDQVMLLLSGKTIRSLIALARQAQAAAPAQGQGHEAVSSLDFHQRIGRDGNTLLKVREVIDDWMLDDDYHPALIKIKDILYGDAAIKSAGGGE